ncbi:hypothetical protein [Massilia sp. BJB1822]|uniref:hypothetical protein n=1 Tax=Massilia sp. BJB1822 TaxID=2744470 RepID=UPI001594C893|nr:hypothetical protein [Massilia sp. BJB1822]NVD97664.1 hypothetical protein [Massilia sp. BJB1822]
MRKQAKFWFQGWQIILSCAEFQCRDGVRKFASTAILKHMPPPLDRVSLNWPDAIRRSIVFPEEAYGTREEANTNATLKARCQVMALNGTSASARS